MFDLKLENIDIDSDGELLLDFMTSDDSYLFSSKKFNSRKSFFDWLYGSIGTVFHDFFCLRVASRTIGFVYSYNFSLVNQNCKILTYIDKDFRNFGVGTFAAVEFINYLFETYPLEKIYTTVFDYNENSLESNFKAGFIEEGELKEYRYYEGKYHSLHYLSITKRQFYEELSCFL